MEFIQRWTFTGLWVLGAVAVFWASSIPGHSLPDLSILSADKLLHALVYAVLAWLGIMSIRSVRPALQLKRVYLITLSINALYGASDEWHQYFVPNRSCEIYDFLADLAGIIITIGVYHWYISRFKVKAG